MKQSRKAPAFYIEALILTLLVLGFVTVLVQVYSAVYQRSLLASQKTSATLIGQTLWAEFSNCPDPTAEGLARQLEGSVVNGDSLLVVYDESGRTNPKGTYHCQLTFDRQPTAAGVLVQTDLAIYPSADIEAAPALCQLDLSRYLPLIS